MRTLGLRRRDAAPAQANDRNVVPGHAERAALPERDLSELAEPVLHLLDAATRTDMMEPLLAALRAARVVVRGTKPRRRRGSVRSTRDALLEHGLPVHIEPETPRVGAMFRDLAAAFALRDRPGSTAA
jgi:hypothetical protein